jgi:hypothetical protein
MMINDSRRDFRQRLLTFFCSLLFASFLPFQAAAIVDANSASNTNAPPDGSPWANVGLIASGASGTYIGGGWVLTASHVGAGSIALAGSAFTPDGTSLRLTNSDGSATDLILFHLTKNPPLPSVPLVSSTPAALSQIDLIGFGHIAGSVQTNIGSYTGFYWSDSGFKSWGNNKVNVGGTQIINIGFGNLTAFLMDFTTPGVLGLAGQTSDEAEVSAGDSGGAAFVKNGATWQLAGILDAEGVQNNQPAATAVYNDGTYAADIATYRGQIMSVLNASPVPSLSISNSGTTALVSWADTGISYNLLSAAGFNNSSWTSVSATRYSANGLINVVLSGNGPPLFLRLQHP